MLPYRSRFTCGEAMVVFFAAAYFTAFDNGAFFRHLLEFYPLGGGNAAFLASMVVGLTACHVLLFSLLCAGRALKPVLTLLLIISAAASYFMDRYNVVFDASMIANIVNTNPAEAGDLLSWGLAGRLFVLGVLPAAVVHAVGVRSLPLRKALIGRGARVFGSALVIVALILMFSRFYASFFREHKHLRYYTNPIFYLYSIGKYVKKTYFRHAVVVQPVGTDARIPPSDKDRELLVVVVGEAARADRFSLNGYGRPTNPLLAREKVYSFTDMHSCGTSTAYSVPCMFSSLPREKFSVRRGEERENLLDVLEHAGVWVLWRDNNSDSKGVVRGEEYQEFKKPAVNPVCDPECRDVGMLDGLQDYVDAHPKGDIVIVLHQMGNHGPAYYKRYPREFARFLPDCRTNELSRCTDDELNNAYDNAILYTDYFLSRVIDFLKGNDAAFETAMIYMSDHGESLGEHGVYLHGLPYAVAPEEQTHVAALMWLGSTFKVDRDGLRERVRNPFSHDNLFHTVLGIVEVKTKVYDPALDILAGLRPEDGKPGG